MREWKSISNRAEAKSPSSGSEIIILRTMCDIARHAQGLYMISCKLVALIEHHRVSHCEAIPCSCWLELKFLSQECIELEKILNTAKKHDEVVAFCCDELESTNSTLHICISQVIKYLI